MVRNQQKNDTGFVCSLSLINNGQTSIPKSGWKIYFNLRYHGYRLRSLNDDFEIKHVSGELFYFCPSVRFAGLALGKKTKLTYAGRGLIANYQDAPAGLFWVSDNDSLRAISLKDIVLHPPDLHITEVVKRIKDIPLNQLPKIFPTPLAFQDKPGFFILDESTTIEYEPDFMKEANYLSDEMKKLIGGKTLMNSASSSNKIVIRKAPMENEAYRMDVKAGLITITTSTGTGAFYAIQSLKSLISAEYWSNVHSSVKIPCIEISDAPRFAVREFMLDVSRNFQSKNEILRMLELMSLYKLNTFHFHFTDDEGWRLEIPGIPELTEIGAKRGYPFENYEQLHPSYGSGPSSNNAAGTGYYSREEYIEILKYASARHILVIPEIESPGHSRAAVFAMRARYKNYMSKGNQMEAEQYLLSDPGDQSVYLSNQGFNDNVMDAAFPSTYRFMEKVIDEIQSMHNEAGAPLTIVHIGGDEVPHGSWSRSPADLAMARQDTAFTSTEGIWRDYFQKINSLLKQKGLSMTGWEELATGTQGPDHTRTGMIAVDIIQDSMRLDAWWSVYENKGLAYALANKGIQVVLSPYDYFYLDMGYGRSFAEPGDAWVGYIDLRKIFSFIPFDYHKNTREDMKGRALPPTLSDSKEKLTPYGKKNILGLQAAMWGENMTRPELLEYMLLPRLLAMAERAWASDPDWSTEKDSLKSLLMFQKEWEIFMNKLAKKELPLLDYYNGGYDYRIPPVETAIRNGRLIVFCELPGFDIRYTTDGSVPDMKSKKYTGPIEKKGRMLFRVFNTKGRAGEIISATNK